MILQRSTTKSISVFISKKSFSLESSSLCVATYLGNHLSCFFSYRRIISVSKCFYFYRKKMKVLHQCLLLRICVTVQISYDQILYQIAPQILLLQAMNETCSTEMKKSNPARSQAASQPGNKNQVVSTSKVTVTASAPYPFDPDASYCSPQRLVSMA